MADALAIASEMAADVIATGSAEDLRMLGADICTYASGPECADDADAEALAFVGIHLVETAANRGDAPAFQVLAMIQPELAKWRGEKPVTLARC